jgi:hypothetical protein
MKKHLLTSALVTAALAVSTAAFAQNWGAYPQTVGNATVETSNYGYAVPTSGFSRSDLSSQGRTYATPRKPTLAR